MTTANAAAEPLKNIAGALRANSRFQDVLDRLVAMSERDYYDPYKLFQWPDSLDEDAYWMSPELMTLHGTEAASAFDDDQLKAISKWESINFYSVNVHGIRELLTSIIARIHAPGFEIPSEYFHHIIGEENDHMWFFAKFCLNYGGKIYPDRQIVFTGPRIPEAENFLIFARLLIFEELVDVYNQFMGGDERLHPTIRQVNAVHHQDESRHIAFGRQIVSILHEELRARLTAVQLAELGGYLKRYMRSSVEMLCSPAAYRDAGVDDPYGLRRSVLADPAFDAYVARALRRSTRFLAAEQIIDDERIPRL
ncbi:diiron oxygenase [Streptomyces sp. NPDC059258]|uniref:diiron oxygenase n=1 Tax=unclassified Streptomyces TaxID=2593676 RepID=UPI0036CF2923